MVAAFPKIFLCPYHLLTHLKSIFVAGISWKITQVKRMPTWLTFVRSEEDDPFRLMPSTLSLHDHLLWGFSSHLLLLRCIPISKWGLRPNTKVQAFAPPHTHIYIYLGSIWIKVIYYTALKIDNHFWLLLWL